MRERAIDFTVETKISTFGKVTIFVIFFYLVAKAVHLQKSKTGSIAPPRRKLHEAPRIGVSASNGFD
jgi:hypothetical protein